MLWKDNTDKVTLCETAFLCLHVNEPSRSAGHLSVIRYSLSWTISLVHPWQQKPWKRSFRYFYTCWLTDSWAAGFKAACLDLDLLRLKYVYWKPSVNCSHICSSSAREKLTRFKEWRPVGHLQTNCFCSAAGYMVPGTVFSDSNSNFISHLT